MANNCAITLTVSGPTDARRALRNAAVSADGSSQFSLESLIPAPQNIAEASPKERADWRFETWGISGDTTRSNHPDLQPECLVYQFATPYSPPSTGAVAAISEAHPALRFHLEYDEPMMAFEGHITAEAGRIVELEHHLYDFYQRYQPIPLSRGPGEDHLPEPVPPPRCA